MAKEPGFILPRRSPGAGGSNSADGKKNGVRFQVEAHGAGAALGGHVFDDRVFVGRILADDGEVTVAAGRKYIAGGGIEASGVGTIADGRSGNDCAGVGVDNGHYFFIADGESAAVLDVHGETRRRLARSKRPAMRFGEFLRVELNELVCVFDVDEDAALAIGLGELGFAAESESSGDCAVGTIDRGGVLAAAVEGEDALGDGVVDDGIGIGVSFYGAERCQGFHVEDHCEVGATGADKAAAEVWRERDAVDALGVGDVAFDGVGVGVHDDDVGAVRNVDAAGGGVDVEIIPAFVTGDGDGLDYVIAGGAWSWSGGAGEKNHAQRIIATERHPTAMRKAKFLRIVFLS